MLMSVIVVGAAHATVGNGATDWICSNNDHPKMRREMDGDMRGGYCKAERPRAWQPIEGF